MQEEYQMQNAKCKTRARQCHQTAYLKKKGGMKQECKLLAMKIRRNRLLNNGCLSPSPKHSGESTGFVLRD